MILVDTSVWVDHLRRGRPHLAARLEQGAVAYHPFVVGELACGRIANRTAVLQNLQELPTTPVAEQDEMLTFIEQESLQGRGLGWVDIHLLAAARLSGCPLWTLDRALAEAAGGLGIGYEQPP
jgi:predicted nucleic acid-binding protein